jgi:hypothetical protein
MLLAFVSLVYVLSKFHKLVICLPIVLYVLICMTVIDGRIYADINAAGYDARIVKALDENLIRQVVEAEENGQTEVTVHIPMHSSSDWPMAVSYGGDRISTSLYRHRITERQMQINLLMDYDINEKFNID